VGKLILSFKGKPIQAYQFETGKIHIGRDSSNNIFIDSLAVAPSHALIDFNQNPPQLNVLDKQFQLLVNGQKKSAHTLAHGDRITIGKHTLIFTEESQSIFSPPEPKPDTVTAFPKQPALSTVTEDSQAADATLQIMSGENIGRLISLKKGLTRIGKKGSGMAIIARRKNGYYLSHLDGENQLMINGKVIDNASTLLKEEDIVIIDSVKMQFFHE
jgi:hypothetical protein